MFGKDANWWFGKNSIFGTAISQTKYGAGQPAAILGQGGSSEAELLKYGMIVLFAFLVIKK